MTRPTAPVEESGTTPIAVGLSAGEAKQSHIVTAALCATVGRTVADAASRLHDIDPDLPGSWRSATSSHLGDVP